MIEELKKRRKLSYLLNVWDDVNLPHSTNFNNIEQQVIGFFKTESQLIYPAKAYFVAIVYAKCIEKYFGIDLYESLNDKELLPDDPYFETYDSKKQVYDTVLKAIDNIWVYKSIQKTVNYFKKEFLIKEDE